MTPDFTNSRFANAMARATAATRASNLGEATRIISEALGLNRAESERRAAPELEAPPAATVSRLDPDAEVIEPEAPRAAPEAAPAIEPEAAPRVERAAGERMEEATAPPPMAGGLPLAGLSRRLRRPLREVLRTLREGRLAAGLTRDGTPSPLAGLVARAPVVEPEMPEGARFEERRFDCAAGGRGYKLYAPAARPVRGLVVMLHGCKQNPDDFAAGTGMNAVAEANGLAVVYPGQSAGDNLSACWNWFRPGDQRREAGEPAIIAGITRAALDELGLAPGRVFVAGHSAGGAMAAVMAEAYPELYAAVGIHSGVPTGAANDALSAFAAMRGDLTPWSGPAETRARTIVFHGEADRTVHPANAARLIVVPPGAPREAGRSAGGRAYVRTVVSAGEEGPGGEVWLIEAAGHAWAGGRSAGSYTDPAGPDASAEMVRFFLEGAEGGGAVMSRDGAAEAGHPVPPA